MTRDCSRSILGERRGRSRRFACSAIFGLLFCAGQIPCPVGNAFAVETVTPGVAVGGANELLSVASLDVLPVNIAVEANRSYECSAQSIFSTSAPAIALYDPLGSPADAAANRIISRGDVAPILQTLPAASGVRLSFTPATSGTYSLRITNDLLATNTFKLRCLETTLYGGFNTNANPFNFLELTNLTGTTIQGRILAYNFDGTQVLNTTFSLAPNRRYDTDVHTAAGANKYGVIIVTHDGPYGAIEGNVSQYGGPVTGLRLSASVPMSVRDQTF